ATKDKALTSANVRLVRWSTKALPDEDAIRRELLRREAERRLTSASQLPLGVGLLACVKASHANIKRRGKVVGRRRAPVNVHEVFQKASQGLSGREIAKVVCVSEAAVRRILTTSREVPKTGGGAGRPVCLKSFVGA